MVSEEARTTVSGNALEVESPMAGSPGVTRAAALPHIRIAPSRGWIAIDLPELWRYRDLLFFLAWRDISVRYKQTVLGATWAIIQPFFSMVVFSLFFGRLARMPSDGVPYPIFSYAALLPWQYFSQAMSGASNRLVASSNLITKVYFPRLVIPLASVLPPAVDFGIAFLVLLGMMAFYRIAPTWNVVYLPLFLLLALVTALGVGLSRVFSRGWRAVWASARKCRAWSR